VDIVNITPLRFGVYSTAKKKRLIEKSRGTIFDCSAYKVCSIPLCMTILFLIVIIIILDSQSINFAISYVFHTQKVKELTKMSQKASKPPCRDLKEPLLQHGPSVLGLFVLLRGKSQNLQIEPH
jgi:hypothetical protein